MKYNNIMVVALQETRIGTNSKEARGAYTWYMSGEEKPKEAKYTNSNLTWAGVGFIIDNIYTVY